MSVHYTHQTGFAHRDLKLENILVDLNYDAKLIDFGFSSPYKGVAYIGEDLTIVGTEDFMAPEMQIAGKKFQGEATDIFALGCILFVMCNGHFPFKSATKDDQNYNHFIQYRP